jgi:hypothetical protein
VVFAFLDSYYLAQERAFRRLYTQSLEIEERLGNQAGLATSCETLAHLMNEHGDETRAVSYELSAFSIRMRMSDRRGVASLERLAQMRARLGRAAFSAITSQSLDADSQEALDRLLDDEAAIDNDVGKPTASSWWPGGPRSTPSSTTRRSSPVSTCPASLIRRSRPAARTATAS